MLPWIQSHCRSNIHRKLDSSFLKRRRGEEKGGEEEEGGEGRRGREREEEEREREREALNFDCCNSVNAKVHVATCVLLRR